MNISIKLLFIFILLILEGCSSKSVKSYSYDQPYNGRPCMFTDTVDYQKCINNSDVNPSLIGRY